MVDVSKRLSGSPKVQPRRVLSKKWVSEPNLLGDIDNENKTWIKEHDNMEEEGVSFAEDVPELTLENVNKQRVQLRPKRRPPTRDFVRSRASMDFDLSIPDEIEEEDETDTTEADAPVNLQRKPTPPAKPSPPPKPTVGNGWRLPTPGHEVVLRKTKPDNIEEEKSDGVTEVDNDDSMDITPQSSPEKKLKERKRFNLHIFRFRRSRKGNHNGKNSSTETERKTNLTQTPSRSVDSGLRPLGEDPRRRWPNRREKGMNWLLGIFHKRNVQHNKDPNDAENSPGGNEEMAKHAENSSNVHATGNLSDTNSNGNTEVELRNGDTSHEDDADPESVSDLRQKFERISKAF